MVQLHKIKGDYYRYISEYASGSNLDHAKKEAENSYQAAMSAAEQIEFTHPNRLGIALNYSVFVYEIGKNVRKAADLARKTFDDAVANVDNVKDEHYKDATLILKLIRDNLNLWQDQIDMGN